MFHPPERLAVESSGAQTPPQPMKTPSRVGAVKTPRQLDSLQLPRPKARESPTFCVSPK